jgi:hypothetical protein
VRSDGTEQCDDSAKQTSEKLFPAMCPDMRHAGMCVWSQ